jgi:hypothetical protein
MVNSFSSIPLARGQQEGPLAMAQAQRGAAVEGGGGGFSAFSDVLPGKVVKGAPYSAVATMEMTQQSSTGNPINRKITSNLYRDSQGRSRREEHLGGHSAVFISDPVSGFDYVLEPENKTARKMPSIPAIPMPMAKNFPPGPGNPIVESGAQTVPGVQSSTESLGQQTIEGVVVDGKRITTTTLAGAIVTEEWFSSELQVVILSKATNQRLGESTYRLTNIRREEPPATLFTLPADYVVKDFGRIPPPLPFPGE